MLFIDYAKLITDIRNQDIMVTFGGIVTRKRHGRDFWVLVVYWLQGD